jgi:hypothetical protein
MRISSSHQFINGLLLATLVVIVIASCQKQTVIPKSGIQTENVILGPPPPPILLAWSAAPRLYLTDQILRDTPVGLHYAQGFTINGKGYIFGGLTITGQSTGEYLGETWELDPASNTWSQKAAIPGGYVAHQSENFVIGNSAYVCNGNNNQNWQYNQSANTWTRKSDIPSVARSWGTGMSINGKGYIGLGIYDQATSPALDAADWWQYDPTSDTWTRKSEFPGGKREGAAGFVVNGKGYVATGYSMTKGYYTDCWQYDPVADSWSKKADFPAVGRSESVSFSGAQAGYVATGYNNVTGRSYNDCLQYVPSTNSWNVEPSIGGVFGPDYYGAAGFLIGTTMYLGTGFVSTANIGLNFWYYPHAN